MSKIMYFLRKGVTSSTVDDLIQRYSLKRCFENKKERIFKNNDMIVELNPKYITVLVYDGNNTDLISDVNACFS